MVTLRDVAARAGVSHATVARVIHRNGHVSEATRARVEVALRESGYRLNAVAQGLRRRRTMTFGHILHGILPNPFFAEVAIGVEHAAASHGFNVLIFNSRQDAERERQGVETLLARQVDGVIFTTAVAEENVRLALDAGVATVEVEKPLCNDAASVLVDNSAGAAEAVSYLLELGHRRIGYIGEPLGRRHDRTVTERFDAYRDTLAAAGIAIDDATVVLGDYWRDPGWADIRTGADYMERLMDQAPDVTAVFAASDLLAAGALQTLYARGIRVPEEMSVLGFDDTFAKHLSPPLTTVRQPMHEMGERAIALAIELLDGAAEASTSWCSTSLVVRDSVGPPAP